MCHTNFPVFPVFPFFPDDPDPENGKYGYHWNPWFKPDLWIPLSFLQLPWLSHNKAKRPNRKTGYKTGQNRKQIFPSTFLSSGGPDESNGVSYVPIVALAPDIHPCRSSNVIQILELTQSMPGIELLKNKKKVGKTNFRWTFSIKF